jgi:hypothetical protein
MEPKKLTQEEVTKLKDLQSQFQELVIILGNLEVQTMDINLRKEELKNSLTSLKQQETVLAKELETKYGNGSISLDTGEFLPMQST